MDELKEQVRTRIKKDTESITLEEIEIILDMIQILPVNEIDFLNHLLKCRRLTLRKRINEILRMHYFDY